MFSFLQKPPAAMRERKAALPKLQAYIHSPGKPVWNERDYRAFADEGYTRNVIAHRCIAMVAQAAASVPMRLFDCGGSDGKNCQLRQHPVLQLLKNPHALTSGHALMEAVVSHRLIAGDAYLLAVGPDNEPPQELHVLRPDRMQVVTNKNGYPAAYRHKIGGNEVDYPIHPVTGRSRVLHVKAFHPLNDYYGLSPMQAAAYSIDIHNQASGWNQSLMQNAARPSGALVVKGEEGGAMRLSEDQFHRLRNQIDEQFSGEANAGRPLLLEGGLEWQEMSLSPKEMDYVEAKHSAARDIALAFGVPPQLLGIPGDNTYANLAEARLALWEQTILPLLNGYSEALNGWLLPYYAGTLKLEADLGSISALTLRQEKLWERLEKATFLSDEEKREMVGIGE